MEIELANNGYIVKTESESVVFEEDDDDELQATENLLWYLIEYCGKSGSRYDKERLRIVREAGDKYEGKVED